MLYNDTKCTEQDKSEREGTQDQSLRNETYESSLEQHHRAQPPARDRGPVRLVRVLPGLGRAYGRVGQAALLVSTRGG